MKKKIIFFLALALSSVYAYINLEILSGQNSARCEQNSFAFNLRSTITEDEKQSIIFMREEEKLARDVYLMMRDKYDIRIFKNISQAEIRHMESVKTLLDKYSVEDPVGTNPVGEFNNQDLKRIYDALIEKGNLSLIDALKCGAEIEELDIADLKRQLEKVTDPDIRTTYEYLTDASCRHLQAFNRNITNRGAVYEPKHLTKAEYDAIINSEKW